MAKSLSFTNVGISCPTRELMWQNGLLELLAKIKPSQNGKIHMSFTDAGRELSLLKLFGKIKFSRKFQNLQF